MQSDSTAELQVLQRLPSNSSSTMYGINGQTTPQWRLLSFPEAHYSRTNSASSSNQQAPTLQPRTTEAMPNNTPGPTLSPQVEARMRRSLRYYFMNPVEKYMAKRRVPYKLLVQIFKIFVVTAQLIVFGQNSASHVNFMEDNAMTFRHLYLKDWDASQETPPYPPSNGPFALYTYEDFYAALKYTAEQYNNTLEVALGSYDFSTPDTPEMYLCQEFYAKAEIFAANQTYNFDSEVLTKCILVRPVLQFDMDKNETVPVFNITQLLQQNNLSVTVDSVLGMWYNFSIKSVQLKPFDYDLRPDCFEFNIKILFDNYRHDGMILVSLTSDPREIPCNGIVYNIQSTFLRSFFTYVDVFVIILSLISCFSCARSLLRGRRAYVRTQKFFRLYYNRSLESDKWEFVNGWFILIIINDILVIIGSIFKIQLDNKILCARSSSDASSSSCSFAVVAIFIADYDVCSYCLGVGSLLVWLGVLRYVSFSYKNNILMLTLVRALPKVLRFMSCAFTLFIAFSLCGWVVLGPYHLKFRTFSSTLECLYSLINGDDMFTTFASVPYDPQHLHVFIFSRIYLYTFCSLFIYVVLNLCITLIIEAYEDVKELRVNKGHPKTPLWNFILSCPDPPSSALYRSDDHERRRLKRRRSQAKLLEASTTSSLLQSVEEEEMDLGAGGARWGVWGRGVVTAVGRSIVQAGSWIRNKVRRKPAETYAPRETIVEQQDEEEDPMGDSLSEDRNRDSPAVIPHSIQ